MNKIYVAGAGGMLGSYVYKKFANIANVKATDIDVNESWLSYADVRDYSTIEKDILKFGPDIIINLSAMTDLEECEQDYNNCFSTNTIGAINLMEIAKKLDVPYVFISTAGVFGGEKEFFEDDDMPIPLSIYAKSKVFAENYLLKNHSKTWIFRAGWMMGGGKRKDKKFISKIMKQIDSGATELSVVDDKLGTPTYTGDFANSLFKHVTELLPYGLYNMVSKGDASRYDVAVKIVELLNLNVTVKKVDSSHFKQSYFAPRPASEKLLNTKLEQLNRNYMNHWLDSLKLYLKEYNES